MADTAQASDLVAELVEISSLIGVLEGQLSDAKAIKEKLEVELLPDAFAKAGVSDLTLPNGTMAKRALKAVGSLPKTEPERTAALDWLVANDYENVIAVEVVATWTKGDRDKALTAYNHLRGDNSATVTKSEAVHPMTLKALAVERVRSGKPVDLTALGVSVVPRVRITAYPKGTDHHG